LRDGAIQTKYYPRPIENIQIDASVTNKTGELSGTKIRLDPFSFTFEGNPFEFSGDFSNPDNLIYSVVSKGSVDLAGKIYRTGILMYGKKLSYREIWRWVRE
jgi:AsmA protein